MPQMKSEIVGATVEYSTGDKLGKVHDILVDATGPRWPVVGLMVISGTPARERLLPVGKGVQVVERGRSRRVVVTGHVQLKPVAQRASPRNRMRLSHIDKARVKGQDQKEVGKAYDFVIATRTDPWRLDRILVRPKGRKARRLRVAPAQVASVRHQVIVLELSSSEAARRARPVAAAV